MPPDLSELSRIAAALLPAQQLDGLLAAPDSEALPDTLHRLIAAAEQQVWHSGPAAAGADALQGLYREVERLLGGAGLPRHHIHVVMPVADRPMHLRACLQSLRSCVEAFGYGGPISVVIADDSAAEDSLAAQQAIAEEFAAGAIETLYFGPQQQWELLSKLDDAQRRQLRNLIGDVAPGRMGHKGASVMRNISKLMLARLAAARERALFFFVDSDQEFHADTRDGEPVYALNYFYHLDRLFREHDIEVLTGKVVGDPPVSPAVMAGTLLQDVLAFVDEASRLAPDAACPFHSEQALGQSAAYHDMSALFGFDRPAQACRYICRRADAHAVAESVLDFTDGLQRFFDGEHPTRSTAFSADDVEASLTTARTVYTGNYVLRSSALRFFIPFASQRLRMAGPTLGRLMQAQIGERFVSANLPMLHKRTHRETGRAELRTGVDRQGDSVDLSGEYERQFLGDLVLFSVAQLVAEGYPDRVDQAQLAAQLSATSEKLHAQYAQVRQELMQRVGQLEARLAGLETWLDSDPRLAAAAAELRAFLKILDRNYSEQAVVVQRLADADYLAQRRQELLQALCELPADRQAWHAILGQKQ